MIFSRLLSPQLPRRREASSASSLFCSSTCAASSVKQNRRLSYRLNISWMVQYLHLSRFFLLGLRWHSTAAVTSSVEGSADRSPTVCRRASLALCSCISWVSMMYCMPVTLVSWPENEGATADFWVSRSVLTFNTSHISKHFSTLAFSSVFHQGLLLGKVNLFIFSWTAWTACSICSFAVVVLVMYPSRYDSFNFNASSSSLSSFGACGIYEIVRNAGIGVLPCVSLDTRRAGVPIRRAPSRRDTLASTCLLECGRSVSPSKSSKLLLGVLSTGSFKVVSASSFLRSGSDVSAELLSEVAGVTLITASAIERSLVQETSSFETA
uniref:Uncharacterized protein n=1 Tax=Ixodes ricinus TaxID=34613 RepID=A0A6B0V828_IXORI